MSSNEEHARLSPSSMDRLFTCVGSLAASERHKKTSNAYADEGTAAHELMEIAFKKDLTVLDKYEGRFAKNGWEFDPEMIEYIEGFVARIRDKVKAYKKAGAVKVELLIEQRVNFDYAVGVKKSFGTSDVIMLVHWKDGTTLVGIEDLKYGMGIQVEAPKNKQLLTYGVAVVETLGAKLKIKKIHIAIHQPRLDHYSEDTITIKELEAFRDELRPIARKAIRLANAVRDGELTMEEIDKKGYLVASKKGCQFCRAKAACPEAARKAFEEIAEDFDVIEDDIEELEETIEANAKKLDKGVIPLARLAEIAKSLDFLDDYSKAVRGYIHGALLDGMKVPHWKLVKGRKARRIWKDIKAAEERLRVARLREDLIYTKRLISPTKAEKLLKDNPRRWNKLAKLISQEDGKPVVAPANDKRDEYDPREEFDNLDDYSNLIG